MYSNEVEEWFVFRSQDRMTNLKRTLDVLLEWDLYIDGIIIPDWEECKKHTAESKYFRIYRSSGGISAAYLKYKDAISQVTQSRLSNSNHVGSLSTNDFRLKNIYCLSCKSDKLFVDRENKRLYCPMCE